MIAGKMKIVGPNGFERSYTLEGSANEHRPEAIRVILGKMLPGKGLIEDRMADRATSSGRSGVCTI
jgi:hypothetical protein